MSSIVLPSRRAPQVLLIGLGNPGKKYENTRHNMGFLAVKHFAQQFLPYASFSKHSKYDVEYCVGKVHLDMKKEYQKAYEKAKTREKNRLTYERAKQLKKEGEASTIDPSAPIEIDESKVKEAVEKVMANNIIFEHVEVHCVLPQSFMNCSGGPARAYIDNVLHAKIPQGNAKKSPFRVMVCYDDVSIPFGQIRLKHKGGTAGHNGLVSIEKHVGTDKYHRLKMGIAPHPSFGRHIPNMADYVLDKFSYDEKPWFPQLLTTASNVMKEYLHKDLDKVMNATNVIDVVSQGNDFMEMMD